MEPSVLMDFIDLRHVTRPAHTQEEKITQNQVYWQVGIWEGEEHQVSLPQRQFQV